MFEITESKNLGDGYVTVEWHSASEKWRKSEIVEEEEREMRILDAKSATVHWRWGKMHCLYEERGIKGTEVTVNNIVNGGV